jgi:hypothetical protein
MTPIFEKLWFLGVRKIDKRRFALKRFQTLERDLPPALF